MSYPKTYRFAEEIDTKLVDGNLMIRRGYMAVGCSLGLGVIAIFAIGVGPLLPATGNQVRSLEVQDMGDFSNFYSCSPTDSGFARG